MNADIIDTIFKSEILQKGVEAIKNGIMSIVPNEFTYFLLWVGIAIALGFYISGKMVTKTIHVITLAVLIFFGIKYIGLV